MLPGHADYVMCLAAPSAGQTGLLASGGLRAEVILWDLNAGAQISQPVSLA